MLSGVRADRARDHGHSHVVTCIQTSECRLSLREGWSLETSSKDKAHFVLGELLTNSCCVDLTGHGPRRKHSILCLVYRELTGRETIVLVMNQGYRQSGKGPRPKHKRIFAAVTRGVRKLSLNCLFAGRNNNKFDLRGRLQLDSAHGHHTHFAVVWARFASAANHRPHLSGAGHTRPGTCSGLWRTLDTLDNTAAFEVLISMSRELENLGEAFHSLRHCRRHRSGVSTPRTNHPDDTEDGGGSAEPVS